MLKNNCDEYLGKFKDEIYVSFENILKLCDDTYHNDIERINISKRKIDDESTTHLVFQTSRIYYDKSLIFFEKYNKDYFQKLALCLNHVSNDEADCMIQTIEKFYEVMCEGREK